MISLLAPVGLAALAAWLLPLLIHWVRRSDRQLVSFAAMRYLSAQAHPRERLRLHEPWLLLLRLLLIAAIALALAVPVLRTPGEPGAPWVLVAPGVSEAAARAAGAAAAGAAAAEGSAARAAAGPAPLAEWHWLAAGWPGLDAPPPSGGASASISSLLRQADAELPPRTTLTVIVPEELGGLDAERVRLTHTVAWRVLPGASPGSGASSEVASGSPAAPLTLSVRADAAGADELPLVRALAAAWQVDGLVTQWDIAPADAPLPATPGWLIWLAGPLPPGIEAWVRRGGTVLASRQTEGGGNVVVRDAGGAGDAGGAVYAGGAGDAGGAVLRERTLGQGRVLSLPGPLRASENTPVGAALSAAEFPRKLLTLMRGPPPAPDRAPAAAVVPLASGLAPLGPTPSLLPYLALGIALLYFGERVLATRGRVRP
jgi:hypothetical protein